MKTQAGTIRHTEAGPRVTAGQSTMARAPMSDALFEAGVSEMRALLARMRPASHAEALKALRAAFPATSLSSRVEAINGQDGT